MLLSTRWVGCLSHRQCLISSRTIFIFVENCARKAGHNDLNERLRCDCREERGITQLTSKIVNFSSISPLVCARIVFNRILMSTGSPYEIAVLNITSHHCLCTCARLYWRVIVLGLHLPASTIKSLT